jgi:hypothetical protein
MKLVHAKLPNGKRLEHCALAAIVSSDQQIELREVVNLFVHALEVAQGQLSDHTRPPFL